MCTVTFIPQPDGFILTTNRDENPFRPKALAPAPYDYGNSTVYFPKDPQGHGSWVAANEVKTICLLNGAFEKHQRKESYRHSRGLIVLGAFQFDHPEHFLANTDMQGIEPYTLVWAESNRLFEIRWDEVRTHLKELDAKKPHIWSSAPLYDARVRGLREQWLNDLLHQNPDPNPDDLLDFHLNGGNQIPEEKIKMFRNNGIPSSISITQIHLSNKKARMRYLDLLNESRHEISFGANWNEPR